MTEFEPPRRQVHRGELPFGPLEVRSEVETDGEGGALLDHEEQEDNRELRHEVKRLMLEGEILQKAAAW